MKKFKMKCVKYFLNRSPFTVLRRTLYFSGLLSLCVLLYYIMISKELGTNSRKVAGQTHLLVWWTEVTLQMQPTALRCGLNVCTITTDRNTMPEAKAILFYGSNMDVYDMPLPRHYWQLWALLHEESPRNVPYLLYEDVLHHFNYTSTFSRYSDFPLTTLSLPNPQDLLSVTYVVPLTQKAEYRYHMAPIMFLQSNCDTMSGRTEYVRELMKYIKVDSYGSCLHNKDMPDRLQEDYLNNLHSPEMYRFMARYKFILAIENGICNDYITEKYWRPLVVGSIPIYFGSPSIKDWEPNNNSAIYISDFNSPKQLAEFVQKLDENNEDYLKYLRHKNNKNQPITNKRLEFELVNRQPYENIFEDFACAMCNKLHEKGLPAYKTASRRHYDCPVEWQYPKMNYKFNESSNQWHSIVKTGGCMASVLNQLLHVNQNYSAHKFLEMLNNIVGSDLC